MSSNSPEYDVVPGSLQGFPPIEKIFLNEKCVGFVYRDPKPPAEMNELWFAYTQSGQGAKSRDQAIDMVLAHAVSNPDFFLP